MNDKEKDIKLYLVSRKCKVDKYTIDWQALCRKVGGGNNWRLCTRHKALQARWLSKPGKRGNKDAKAHKDTERTEKIAYIYEIQKESTN